MIKTKHILTGWAVSPVHIGDGSKLDPSSFKLIGDKLGRFNSAHIIANMDDSKRNEYIKFLSQGGVKQAQELIRKFADKYINEKIAISNYSINDVKESLTNLRRSGEISPFVRSGGKPFLPGTSIKGALRTAWLAKCASENPTLRDTTKSKAKNEQVGKTTNIAKDFEQRALDYQPKTMEKDPFRDLLVSDGVIGKDSTIIDKVQIAKLGRGRACVEFGAEKGIQIHVERLNSIFDSKNAPASISLEIAIPESKSIEKRKNIDSDKSPIQTLQIEELQKANNLHHAKLWFMELDAFYKGTGTDILMKDLLNSLQINPENPQELANALNEKGAWLMKIGRYAHFEAKSIEGMRFGEKRGTKTCKADFITEHASSRQLAKRNDETPLPFGWIILFSEGKIPQNLPKVGQTIIRTYNSNNQQAKPNSGSVLSSKYIFNKGDILIDPLTGDEAKCCENVSLNASEMSVDFGDGPEPVNIKDWKKA